MPILVPQSAVDAAVSAWKKQEGILDEMPKDGFSVADLSRHNMSRNQARTWIQKNAKFVGVFGPKRAKIYKLLKGK